MPTQASGFGLGMLAAWRCNRGTPRPARGFGAPKPWHSNPQRSDMRFAAPQACQAARSDDQGLAEVSKPSDPKIAMAVPNQVQEYRAEGAMSLWQLYRRATADATGRAVRLAVASQLLCACYLQFIEWIPLFPWNNLAYGNKQEVLDGVLAILQLAFAIGFAYHKRWVMAPALVGYGVWLALQVYSWWLPYLFGGRKVGPNWLFARTHKFLPAIGDRPTPDAAHVVLQSTLVLVIITGIAAWRATGRDANEQRTPSTHPA
jgi:hypothetical protein